MKAAAAPGVAHDPPGVLRCCVAGALVRCSAGTRPLRCRCSAAVPLHCCRVASTLPLLLCRAAAALPPRCRAAAVEEPQAMARTRQVPVFRVPRPTASTHACVTRDRDPGPNRVSESPGSTS
eukprot:CAMPEP_0172174926 /NCGR_PEP_ID=MMETSP1050-20130122/13937_1 /TAXON_ID=233186 /ORGANISM="Cryptomonas curvata, Strain CCAP979/52" /LENGTH=121 /DNA_ID=CAMNT_0012846959 /DNA_START=413 /DNA_END=778 /DNA_ORIENTATION=-